MSGMAQYLHMSGYIITGSDRQANDRTEALVKAGVKVHIGHNEDNPGDAELVVRTSAVHNDNVEVRKARSRNIPVILREQMLGAIFNSFDTRIAVCGTHGKTTVTAMIHEILTECGVSHTALIGGVYHGNNFYYGKDVVVAEACEYNRSFLNLNPTICVCVNAEYDHPDCYADKEEIRQAFCQFMNNTTDNGVVVLPRDLEYLPIRPRKIIYDDNVCKEVELIKGKPVFAVYDGSGGRKEVRLNVCGRHNVQNASAALSVARHLELPLNVAVQALARFDGVDRRWTESDGICKVVRDYAHHPTEIACSVDTASNITDGRVICIFQPHTYSRTEAFWNEFVTCFDKACKVAYLPIYSAREQPIEGVTSENLAKLAVEQGYDAAFVSSFDEAITWAKNTVCPNDLLLILGAGDVAELADSL